MALNGVRRKNLAMREGADNSNLPSSMQPLDRGPVDTVMANVHGSNPQTGDSAVTKMTGCHCYHSAGGSSDMAGYDPVMDSGFHQAQGAETQMVGESVDVNFRTQVHGHSGHGPNPGCGGKAVKKM